MSQKAPLEKRGSVLAEEILGHKLDDNTSRDDVKKILEEVITEHKGKLAAEKQSQFRGRVLVLGAVGVLLAFGACVAAVALGVEVTRDTKHSHQSGTTPGTQELQDVNGDTITTSLTMLEENGDAALCALLHPDDFGDDHIRAMGAARDVTISYQSETGQMLLNLRVASIEYGAPDDAEDDEAALGEITSVSGRFGIVLQQGGAVVVRKDDKVFATDTVCDVVEHRRRLHSDYGIYNNPEDFAKNWVRYWFS